MRELAAIHRSDLTLVCSRVEMRLLHETYGVAKEKLAYAPFFVDEARWGEEVVIRWQGWEEVVIRWQGREPRS